MIKKLIKILLLIILIISTNIEHIYSSTSLNATINYQRWIKDIGYDRYKLIVAADTNWTSPFLYKDYIYFTIFKNPVNSDIYRVSIRGGIKEVIFNESYIEKDIVFAKNGIFAYISNFEDVRGDIYYGMVDKNGNLKVKDKLSYSLGYEGEISISQDGKYLVYISNLKYRTLVLVNIIERLYKYLDNNAYTPYLYGNKIYYIKNENNQNYLIIYDINSNTQKKYKIKLDLLNPIYISKRNKILLYNKKKKFIVFYIPGKNKYQYYDTLNFKIYSKPYYDIDKNKIFVFAEGPEGRGLYEINPDYYNVIPEAPNIFYQYYYALNIVKRKYSSYKEKKLSLESVIFYKDSSNLKIKEKALDLMAKLFFNYNKDTIEINNFIANLSPKLKTIFIKKLVENFLLNFYEKRNIYSVDYFYNKLLKIQDVPLTYILKDLKDSIIEYSTIENLILSDSLNEYRKKIINLFLLMNSSKYYTSSNPFYIKKLISYINKYSDIENDKKLSLLIEKLNDWDLYNLQKNVKIDKYKTFAYFLYLKRHVNILKTKEDFLLFYTELKNIKRKKLLNDSLYIKLLNYYLYQSKVSNIPISLEKVVNLYDSIYLSENTTILLIDYIKWQKRILYKKSFYNTFLNSDNFRNFLSFNKDNIFLWIFYIDNNFKNINSSQFSKNSYYYYYYLAYYYLLKYNYTKNLKVLKLGYKNIYRFYEQNPKDVHGLLLLAKYEELFLKDNSDYKQFTKVIEIYNYLLSIDTNRIHRKVIYYNIAIIYWKMNNIYLSQKYFDKIVNTIMFSSDKDRGIFYYYYAKILVINENYKKAIKYLNKSLNILLKYDEEKYLLEIYRLFAYIYQLKKEPQMVSKYIDKILSLNINEYEYLAKIYSNQAVTYLMMDDEVEAYINALKSEAYLNLVNLDKYEKKTKIKIKILFLDLTVPFFTLFQLGKARYTFDIYDEIALIKSVKWNYYRKTGVIGKSKYTLLRKLEMAKKKKDFLMEAIVLNNLGYYYEMLNDSLKAKEYYINSLRLCYKYYEFDRSFLDGILINLINLLKFNLTEDDFSLIMKVIYGMYGYDISKNFKVKLKFLEAGYYLKTNYIYGVFYAYFIYKNILNKFSVYDYQFTINTLFLLSRIAPFEERLQYKQELFNFNKRIGREHYNFYYSLVYDTLDTKTFYKYFIEFYNNIAYFKSFPPYFDLKKLNKSVLEYLKLEKDTSRFVEVFERNVQLGSFYYLKDFYIFEHFDSEIEKNFYANIKNYYQVMGKELEDSLTIYVLLNKHKKVKEIKDKYERLKKDYLNFINSEIDYKPRLSIYTLYPFSIYPLIEKRKENVIYIVNNNSIELYYKGKNKTIIVFYNKFKKYKGNVSEEELIYASSYLDYLTISYNTTISSKYRITLSNSSKKINIESLQNLDKLTIKENFRFNPNNILLTVWQEYQFSEFIDTLINNNELEILSTTFPMDNINISILNKLLAGKGFNYYTINNLIFGRTLKERKEKKKWGEEKLKKLIKAGIFYQIKQKEYRISIRKLLQAENLMHFLNKEKDYDFIIRYNLTKSYFLNKDYSKALKIGSMLYDSLSKCKTKKDTIYRVKIALLLGKIAKEMFLPTKAIFYYQDAYNMGIKLNNKKLQALAAYNLATIYSLIGNYEKVIEYAEKSTAISKEIGDYNKYLKLNYFQAGIYLDNLGLIAPAKKIYFNLLKDSILKIDDYIKVNFSLVGLYSKIGDFDSAKVFLEKVRNTLKDNKLTQINYYKQLFYLYKGQLFIFSSDIDSLRYILMILDSMKIENIKNKLSYFNLKVYYYLSTNEIEMSNNYNDSILYLISSYKELSYKKSLYYINKGWIYYRKNNYSKAREYFIKAIDFDKGRNTSKDLIGDYKHIIVFAYKSKDYKLLEDYYREYYYLFQGKSEYIYFDWIINYYYLRVFYKKDRKFSNTLLKNLKSKKLTFSWRINFIYLENGETLDLDMKKLTSDIKNDNTNKYWNWNFFDTYREFIMLLINNYLDNYSLKELVYIYKNLEFYFDYNIDSMYMKLNLNYNLIFVLNLKEKPTFIKFENGSWSIIQTIENIDTNKYYLVLDKGLWFDTLYIKFNYYFPFFVNNDFDSTIKYNKEYYKILYSLGYIDPNIVIANTIEKRYKNAFLILDKNSIYNIDKYLLLGKENIIIYIGDEIYGYLFYKKWKDNIKTFNKRKINKYLQQYPLIFKHNTYIITIKKI